MAIKLNSLNPFDRGFFGKTMAAWAKINKTRGEMLNPSNLKMSSIDDFNKHFQDKLFPMKFERAPHSDNFSKAEKVENLEIPDQFSDFFS